MAAQLREMAQQIISERQQDPERLSSAPVFRSRINQAQDYGIAQKPASAQEEAESDELLPPSPDGHYPFLDITRVACVACVCVDHGSSDFGRYNILFAQDWVLQFLFLVSGIGYGMSKRGLLGYEMRLGMYFIIGVCVNWVAYVVKGLDWKNDFFNVVFHLWFVVGLMIYALILAPLKSYLARVSEEVKLRQVQTSAEPKEPDQKLELLKVLGVIGGGFMGILLFFQVLIRPFILPLLAGLMLRISLAFGSGGGFWGWPQDLDQSNEFLIRINTYFMSTMTNLYLILVGPKCFQRTGITTWVVLVSMYASRAMFYRSKEERPFKGMDLMMLTLACYFLGLTHRRKIGEYVVRYWFVVLFACVLLWPEGLHERLDEDPPLDPMLRFRAAAIEFIFVAGWMTAGERMVQREVFTEDNVVWLNDWALLVFLVHKAVHIVFPSPVNWLVLAGLVPLCYWRRSK